MKKNIEKIKKKYLKNKAFSRTYSDVNIFRARKHSYPTLNSVGFGFMHQIKICRY